MDPRTRFILYQMLNRGLLTEINGCVSTGKEVTTVNVKFIARPMCITLEAQRELNLQ